MAAEPAELEGEALGLDADDAMGDEIDAPLAKGADVLGEDTGAPLAEGADVLAEDTPLAVTAEDAMGEAAERGTSAVEPALGALEAVPGWADAGVEADADPGGAELDLAIGGRELDTAGKARSVTFTRDGGAPEVRSSGARRATGCVGFTTLLAKSVGAAWVTELASSSLVIRKSRLRSRACVGRERYQRRSLPSRPFRRSRHSRGTWCDPKDAALAAPSSSPR